MLLQELFENTFADLRAELAKALAEPDPTAMQEPARIEPPAVGGGVEILFWGVVVEGTSNKIWGWAKRGNELVKFWGKNLINHKLRTQVFPAHHLGTSQQERIQKIRRGYDMMYGNPRNEIVKNWIMHWVSRAQD
jgi:hypothetical protein